MSRPLRIAVALSAFALGLALAGAAGQIPHAVPAVSLVGLGLAALWKRLRRPDVDAHAVKVAALTLALWVPLLALFTALISQPSSDSFVYESPAAETEWAEVVKAEPPVVKWDAELLCRPGATVPVNGYANVIWGGVIDRKALSKPKPSCLSGACSPNISSTVAVVVVVDGNGRVVVARPLSGAAHLRAPAALAACEARFSPTLFNGVPPLVSGLLTYQFGD